MAGLQKGRLEARESEPVKPVEPERVEAIRPFVTPQVWAIVQLQRLTAARSGESCLMRGIDVDRSGLIWIYRLRKNKNAHHGHAREILSGPRAQAILIAWLRTDEAAYLFQPAERSRSGRRPSDPLISRPSPPLRWHGPRHPRTERLAAPRVHVTTRDHLPAPRPRLQEGQRRALAPPTGSATPQPQRSGPGSGLRRPKLFRAMRRRT